MSRRNAWYQTEEIAPEGLSLLLFQLPDLVTILWGKPLPSVPCVSSTFLLAILIPKISETGGGIDLEVLVLFTMSTIMPCLNGTETPGT